MGIMPTAEECNWLVQQFSSGDFAGLEVNARTFLVRYPDAGFLWKVLGIAQVSQGKGQESLAALQKAANLMPADAEVHNSLGNAFKDLGRFAEAEVAYRSALQRKSEYPVAHFNLGSVFQEQGCLADAEICYRNALLLAPDFVEALYSLGVVHDTLGRKLEAEACYRDVLGLRSNHAEACYNLAILLVEKGCMQEALELNRRAIIAKPGFGDALNNLGRTLMALGRVEESAKVFRQAVDVSPEHADAWVNLGQSLQMQGLGEEAERCYRRTLTIRHDFVEAYNGLSDVLRVQGRFEEAEAACLRAIEIKPDYLPAYVNLGIMLLDQGRLREAEDVSRQALCIDPDFSQALGNLLFLKNYSVKEQSGAWIDEARNFGKILREKVSSAFHQWMCAGSPRRLRVGLVSGDFRDHSVGHFLESLLAEIDQERIELIAYPTLQQITDLTFRIVPYFSAWKPLVGLDDEAAARMIHGDGVHVLLDLSGVTAHNRLSLFAWKPAPVQASWLGYCATTGVAEIDYYIADANTLPSGQERFFTESIWRLPDTYLCFSPPVDQVPVSSLPAMESGHVTFGSFNNLTKVNEDVIALWARLIHEVPGSKLFLKAVQLKDDSVRNRLLEQFSSLGVGHERLILEGPIAQRGGHLATYCRVDIGLDPFPYNGVTTTMEALWMGVPVLTLEGHRFLSRQGVGILTNVGLSNWIAQDEDDFVAKAKEYAADVAGLRALRAELRERVRSSPILDGSRFARNFEDALWQMWQVCPVRSACEQAESTVVQKSFSMHQAEFKALDVLFSKGDSALIAKWIDLLSREDSQSAVVWKVLGAALDSQGQDSVVAWQKAAALLQDDPEAFDRMGNALMRQARFQEALECYSRSIQINPLGLIAKKNMVLALRGLGRLAEAEACCRQVLETEVDDLDVWSNLGVVLKARGKLVEAESAYRRALELSPDYAEGYYNLALLMHENGRLAEAEASYRQAVKLNSGYAEALSNLALLLRDVARLEEAEACCRQAIEANPKYFGAYNNLGVVLRELGRLDEAEESYRHALGLSPGYAEALSNLSLVQRDAGHLIEAEESCRQAIQLKPDCAGAYNNIGAVLCELGRTEEAEASYRKVEGGSPAFLDAFSNLLFSYNYSSVRSPDYCFEEACRYGREVAARVKTRYSEWQVDKEPRRLRVGLVSGDLCDHSVGYFLEGMLKVMDAQRIELIAYPSHHKVSELTYRIRPYFAAWHSLVGMGDDAAAKLIHDDKIHILIDLSGHTAFNRLPVFARRPAPVQMSWLGYCATTGVAEIDYYLADAWTLRPEQERYFTEMVRRLPDSYICFSKPACEIGVSELPALATGGVTFGSFNNLSKVTDEVIAVWSRILLAVSGSRLILKAKQLKDGAVRTRVLEQFGEHGITKDRLLLMTTVDERTAHLATYHQIDVALDPFPYNGVTTTVEALWMGVPVLTLAGERFLSRQGAGILSNLGLKEWVANDVDELVSKAVSHATDIRSLQVLRSRLRGILQASPIFDARRFAKNFDNLLWEISQYPPGSNSHTSA